MHARVRRCDGFAGRPPSAGAADRTLSLALSLPLSMPSALGREPAVSPATSSVIAGLIWFEALVLRRGLGRLLVALFWRGGLSPLGPLGRNAIGALVLSIA